MNNSPEFIEHEGRMVRRFVSYPEPIMDGTIRCGVCGQLDDFAVHDDTICEAVERSNRAGRAAIKEADHDA